jgi:hypothetical protein
VVDEIAGQDVEPHHFSRKMAMQIRGRWQASTTPLEDERARMAAFSSQRSNIAIAVAEYN